MSRRIHTLTSTTTGKTYEVTRTRTRSSFSLPTWHYRRTGDKTWQTLSVDTLRQAKDLLHAS